MTKLSGWGGILEVKSECFEDKTPRFYAQDDPFVIRFQVKCIAWLDKETAVPIYEDKLWKTLSFTKDSEKHSACWTGKVRSSLHRLSDEDGKFLESVILSQLKDGQIYPVNAAEYARMVAHRICTTDWVS